MNEILKQLLDDPHFQEGIAWQRKSFSAGDKIVREGDKGKSVFFIEMGKLRVISSVGLEKNQQIQPGIWELEEGDIFGEMCLYQEQIRSASVIGVKDGSILEFDGQRLSIYLDDHPILGYLFLKDVFEILIARLNRANQRVEDLFAWGLKAHGIGKHL